MYEMKDLDPEAKRPLFIAKMKWWKQPGPDEEAVTKKTGK